MAPGGTSCTDDKNWSAHCSCKAPEQGLSHWRVRFCWLVGSKPKRLSSTSEWLRVDETINLVHAGEVDEAKTMIPASEFRKCSRYVVVLVCIKENGVGLISDALGE